MIKVSNLTLKYGNTRDFSFNFPEHGFVVITGESGAGKTTFLRCLSGLLPPSEGEVSCLPENIAVVFQDDRLLPWYNAVDNIKAVVPYLKGEEVAINKIIIETLSSLGLSGEDVKRLPAELSGGQQRRVAIARALVYQKLCGAGLLVLDEPFSGLDDDNKARVMAKLSLVASAIPVVIATHDLEPLAEVAEYQELSL